MKKRLLHMLLTTLVSMLTPELLKSFLDMALDFVEEKVAGSKSEVDDAVILPVCNMIRIAFDVPDDD